MCADPSGAARRRHGGYRFATVLVAAALLAVACSGDDDTESSPAETTAVSGPSTLLDAAETAGATPSSTEPTPADPAASDWRAIHHDGRNSGSTGAVIAESFGPLQRFAAGRVGATAPTIVGDRMYITLPPQSDTGCVVFALDLETLEEEWCAAGFTFEANASSVLADEEGNLYVGDRVSMASLDPTGAERWRTEIVGFPLSAQQFGPEHIVFGTHYGRIYLLAADTGDVVTQLDLASELVGAAGEGRPLDCLVGREYELCPASNTPAVRMLDDGTGVVYTTLQRTEGIGSMVAIAIDPATGESSVVWQADILSGGSAASPSLGPDGTRLYVNDLDGFLHAVDVETGEVFWSFDIGFATIGSAAVSPDGLIVPGGGGRALGIADRGDVAETRWIREDIQSRGLVMIDGRQQVVLTSMTEGEADLKLEVLDGRDGSTVNQVPLDTLEVFSTAVVVAPSGLVVIVGLNTGLFLLPPA